MKKISWDKVERGKVYLLINARNDDKYIFKFIGWKDINPHKNRVRVVLYSGKYHGKIDTTFKLRQEINDFIFIDNDIIYELSENEAIAWMI